MIITIYLNLKCHFE